jgi:MFS family permease
MAEQQSKRIESFPAIRHSGFRAFLLGGAAAMLADNVEHVITYWVVFQKFRSPALGGFAVIAHWVPFLVLSVPIGALGDRLDPRRLIQLGMAIFMLVSVTWGLLILTESLQAWHAMVLLVMHGIAGVLWGPPSQLLLHDIVGPQHLQSAVRLNSTGRYLGMLLGPAVGSGMLLLLGPGYGLIANALIYAPLTLWLWNAPYGPRFRAANVTGATTVRTLRDILVAVHSIRQHPTIASMTLLAGGAAFFVGNAYQAQMPGFAVDLGHGNPGVSYSALLAADAAGALTAGVGLESVGWLRARVRTAFLLGLLWCLALSGFALSRSYPLALTLLFLAGFLELAFNSMTQTLVQLTAPADMRGRMIGVFSMAAAGMRAFSGITVGLVGQYLGIHWSLALSAALLFVSIVALGASRRRLAKAYSNH